MDSLLNSNLLYLLLCVEPFLLNAIELGVMLACGGECFISFVKCQGKGDVSDFQKS